MEHKGYKADIKWSDEDDCFIGKVAGLKDNILFHGDDKQELREAFHASVDSYLEHCEKKGKTPDRDYSGKFVVRIDPEVHRALDTFAQLHNESLNSVISDILNKVTIDPGPLESLSQAIDKVRSQMQHSDHNRFAEVFKEARRSFEIAADLLRGVDIDKISSPMGETIEASMRVVTGENVDEEEATQ